MKIPEHMDSTDLCPDNGPSDDELRVSLRDWLKAPPATFDAAEFFEYYVDPEGPFRWCGSFDADDAIEMLLDRDPHMLAECLREWMRECN